MEPTGEHGNYEGMVTDWEGMVTMVHGNQGSMATKGSMVTKGHVHNAAKRWAEEDA